MPNGGAMIEARVMTTPRWIGPFFLVCAACSSGGGTTVNGVPSGGSPTTGSSSTPVTVDSYEELFVTPSGAVNAREFDGLYTGSLGSGIDVRLRASAGKLWIGVKRGQNEAFGFAVDYQIRGATEPGTVAPARLVVLRSGAAEQGNPSRPSVPSPGEPMQQDEGYVKIELAVGDTTINEEFAAGSPDVRLVQ